VLFSTRDKNTRQKDGSGKDPDEKGKASESSLWLFYKVGPSPDTWWGMVTKSDDGGKSWGKPERLPDGILGPIKNKPVLLGDDRLLCGSSTEHDGWKVHMEWLALSSNRWEKTPALAMGAARGAIQPTILQYGQGSDTRLQILCRSRGDGKILGSWSNDMGRTWTDLAAIQLPNPNSGIDGVTLRNGKQLLVYNHTPSGRSPLNVAWSTDGSAWHAGAILEHERGEYSYPAVIQTADGRVHITYTWKRQRVRHVELDPDKLASRPIVDGKWPE
jgi:predicted neuraminidase